jgi:SAM-dependent methyltransferase
MSDWGVGDYELTAAELEPVAPIAVQAARITAGERVLDVGCGTGNAALAAAAAGALVTGVDPAARLVAVAAERAAAAGHRDARFVVGDAEELPFEGAQFDAALSVFALIFAADPGRAADELLRVLAPGGRAVLTTWVPSGAVHESIGLMAVAAARAAGQTPQPRFAWGEERALRELFEPRGARLEVAARELAFTAASVDAYLVALEDHHPLALPMRAVLEDAGRYDEVRRQAAEILAAANEDPAAFRVTSRYLLVRVELP